MRPRQDPSDELDRLAALQAGVVSTAQAAGLGLSRHSVARLLERRQWSRIGPGVYLVGPGEPGWLGLAWAGVLIGGERSRLAGTSAAFLHGMLDSPPETVTILVPHDARPASRAHWQFVRERPGVRSSRSVGNPPRLAVEDCVLDLCATGSDGDAASWATAAVQRRRTTPTRLRRALTRRTLHPRRQLLVDLLADVEEGAESPLELRYLRDVERAHGLPRGRRQVRDGRHGVVRDLVYDEFGLVVELDGRRGHEGGGRFRDMNRDNLALVSGLVTLRYGWFDVGDRSCAVARQVGDVLIGRGWPGFPTRCRRC